MKKNTIIFKYTLQEAIADGELIEIFKNRWDQLSRGKPIVATNNLFNEVSLTGLREIWNEYVVWKKNTMPTLPEKEQFFVTTMNGNKVWVTEDDQSLTLMYPEDY